VDEVVGLGARSVSAHLKLNDQFGQRVSAAIEVTEEVEQRVDVMLGLNGGLRGELRRRLGYSRKRIAVEFSRSRRFDRGYGGLCVCVCTPAEA